MTPWFERTFQYGRAAADAPAILDRLRATPGRLERLRGLPVPLLTHRPQGRWSIQEHAGHLLDLEELFERRLDDFEAGAPVLRAADLQNTKTWKAGHNQRPLPELIEAFGRARARFLARVDAMSDRDFGRTARHPRLQQPMSVADHAFFVAEHDDHHLAWMAEIETALGRMPVYALDLLNTVEAAVPELLAMDRAAVSARPAPGKWSPKEIIGHLIDSASNNHQRFVRALFQEDLVFPGYQQDEWVAVQRYHDEPWEDLVALWAGFNRHLGRYMAAIPEQARLGLRTRHNLDVLAWNPVPADQPSTLDYFMADYVGHLHHHLNQIRAYVNSQAPTPNSQRESLETSG